MAELTARNKKSSSLPISKNKLDVGRVENATLGFAMYPESWVSSKIDFLTLSVL